MSEWEREFHTVFDRAGLIIDVRHNRGGNIDSWVLENLMLLPGSRPGEYNGYDLPA